MGLQKPTLEEVREHFKYAKKIKSIISDSIYKINTEKLGVYFDGRNYRQNTNSDDSRLLLWEENKGYAEIISENYKITKETILKYNMKDEFPGVFETKLETGKWYKGNVDFESLIFITKIEKCKNEEREYSRIHYYGFESGGYRVNDTIANKDHEDSLKEASHEEVEEALIREAKKRYKKGDYINGLYMNKISFLTFENIGHGRGNIYVDEYFSVWMNIGNFRNEKVFDQGKWATVIPTITKEEAEKKLNCKII